jgi:hypothetical protein
MSHLLEVELTGLTGIDCELWFMKAVIASAERLRKVDISFNPKCWQHECKMDAFERRLLDEEMRTSRRDKFMLTSLSKSPFGRASAMAPPAAPVGALPNTRFIGALLPAGRMGEPEPFCAATRRSRKTQLRLIRLRLHPPMEPSLRGHK